MNPVLEARQLVVDGQASSLPMDWQLLPGEVWRLDGERGSGKTSLLKTLLGLLTPRAGQVRIAQEDVVGMSQKRLLEVRGRVGAAFAEDGLISAWSVQENLSLPLVYHGRMNLDDANTETGNLFERLGLPAGWLERPAARLAQVQRRAVSVARALLASRDLLLLDGLKADTIGEFDAGALWREIGRLSAAGTAVLLQCRSHVSTDLSDAVPVHRALLDATGLHVERAQ